MAWVLGYAGGHGGEVVGTGTGPAKKWAVKNGLRLVIFLPQIFYQLAWVELGEEADKKMISVGIF
jgi:hypothetical protein